DALGDALAAALTFHAFHAHAARLGMADIAQALTARQAMIRTDGAAMMLTPTYYAFRMHVPFQAATTLPLSLANNPQYSVGGLGVPAVSASAARAIDGKLYLSLVNADAREAATVAIGVNGASLKAASGSVLAAAGADARNKAATLAPAPLTAHAENGKLRLTLPPKSLTVLAIDE
ncbi:MAG: alpha-L-arabinofuranosidase C-terminal domain-containing protein, partial [Massilia sp.]